MPLIISRRSISAGRRLLWMVGGSRAPIRPTARRSDRRDTLAFPLLSAYVFCSFCILCCSRHHPLSLCYRRNDGNQTLSETFNVVITDPPYYDNISYADLSDFFYVWLKRSI